MGQRSFRLALSLILTVPIAVVADEPAPGPAKDLHGDVLPPGAIARLGTLRFRAARGITHLAFSPDGKRLAAKSRSSISVWDVTSGRKQTEFVDIETGPFAWRADGSGVMLVRDGKSSHRFADFTRAWLPPTPVGGAKADIDPVGTEWPTGEDRINEYALSPDAKYLVAGRTGDQEKARAITVWELDPGKPRLRPLHNLGPLQGTCHQIVFSADGRNVGIVSGPKQPSLTQDVLFVLYDLATGRERARRAIAMPVGIYRQMTIALTEAGRYLAVAGSDHRCHIYDLGSDAPEVTFEGAKDGSAKAGWLALAIAGEQVFSVRWADRSLHVHDVKTGRPVRSAVKTTDWVEAIAFSPDGRRMATSGPAGIIRLWDVASGQEIDPPAGHQGSIVRVHMTADDRVLTTDTDGEPRLWDAKTGKELARFELPIDSATVALAPDKTTLLAISGHGIIAFDLTTGARAPLPEKMAKVSRSGRFFSGDRNSVVIGEGMSIGIWAWPEGRLRREFEFGAALEGVQYAEIFDAGLTPDGKMLLVHTKGCVDLWNVATGRFQARLTEGFKGSARGIAYFDEGRHVALAVNHSPADGGERPEGNRLGLWDLRSGRLVRTFESYGSQLSRDIAADPRGYLLATAEEGDSGVALLYEVASGQIRRRIPGHIRSNTSAAFSSDGDRLVTVGSDKTGLVWDISLKAAARGRKPASQADLELAWSTLAKPDASAAYDAQIAIASNPGPGIELIGKRLKGAVLDIAAIDRLLADLDSEAFVTREKASRELGKLGRPEVAALQARSQKEGSLELKRRLANFLDRYEMGPMPPDELRAVRALEIMESLGGPTARAVIAELTKGEPIADLTLRALAVKGRLDRRKN